MAPPSDCSERPLPDLSQRLADQGLYEGYVAWREQYRCWRSGRTRGAPGELSSRRCAARACPGDGSGPWRSAYQRWRRGAPYGASGEASEASAPQLQPLLERERLREAPAVVFDVVAAPAGEAGQEAPALVPVDGPRVPPMPVDDLPADALVTVRVFRFFEDKADAESVWEQELRNVNSGSLAWLPAHLAPGVHSLRGAKYGKWFTIHYITVKAKHFASKYFMANEGSSYPAKTFGSTSANSSTVSGEQLPEGYFWYVSPAGDKASLAREGWQHLCRAGPFDGESFLEEWRQSGAPMEADDLQEVLHRVADA